MSTLRSEIEANYLDMYYLVAPQPAVIPKQRSSDNGCLFSSEYYIQLIKNNELLSDDKEHYEALIRSCMIAPGLVSRVPGDDGQGPPDDAYGIAAACSQFGITSIPNEVVNYGLKHFGSFNNKEPGKWTTSSFLWRQLPLVASQFAAARRGRYNPFVWCLNAIAAIVIATSCIGVDPGKTDKRKLSYLLIQAMTPVSVLCRLASILWKRRAVKDYGPEFMKAIYGIYFGNEHPLAKYAKY